MSKEFKMTDAMVNNGEGNALSDLAKSELDKSDNVGFFTRILSGFIPDFLKSKIVPVDTYFDKKKSQFVIKFEINTSSGGSYKVHIAISCAPQDEYDSYTHFMKVHFPDGVIRKFTYESTQSLGH